MDVLTDALQHTQKKRATSRQEDPGVLESMRLSNGTAFVYPKSLGPFFLGCPYYQQTPDSESSTFHLISATSRNQPPQPLSLSLPPSPNHNLTPKKNSQFHVRSRSVLVQAEWDRIFAKGRGRTATQSCFFMASSFGCPSGGDSGRPPFF